MEDGDDGDEKEAGYGEDWSHDGEHDHRDARSNNSTGYFLDLGITDFSFQQGRRPTIEVSVKPGMAQVPWRRRLLATSGTLTVAFLSRVGISTCFPMHLRAHSTGWID